MRTSRPSAHHSPQQQQRSSDPEAPQGSRRGGQRPHGKNRGKAGGPYWIAGVHACQAALENPHRTVLRVLLSAETKDSFESRIAVPLPPATERADKARFTAFLGAEAVHQGVAMLVEPLEPVMLEDALERPGPVLVLDQVTDPRNIGAILRSAAAFGASCVVIQDRHAPEEGAALAKAASGALEVVPLVRVVNLARCLETLKQHGCWVLGLDAGGQRLDGAKLDGRRAALVLGSEGDGLRRLTRENCDEIVGLLMPGTMESLNVSVAAAIGLYELVRKD